MAGRTVGRRPAVAVAIATVLVAGACTTESSGLPDPPTSTPDVIAPAPTVDPLHQEILDAYQGSLEAMVAAQAAGDPDHPELARYYLSQTPALLNLQTTIASNDRRGTYYAGELAVVTATVTDVDLDGTPPAASVESCVDYSGYQLVHRADDTPVPDAEPRGRVPSTAELIRANDDRWYISANTADWDHTC